MSNNLLFLYFFAIIGIFALNSLFVISEIAILTSNRHKLHKMQLKGNIGAKQAIKLSNEPDAFLSSVQIGITLMSLLLGFLGGSSVGKYIGFLCEKIPYISKYSSIIGYVASLLIITYITVLSEIVPKRIAMLYPEKIASIISYFMHFMIKFFYPLVITLTFSSKLCLKFLRIKESVNHVSADEIKFLMSQAEHSGTLQKTEYGMIKRLINLSDTQVGAIMTPRNKIIALDLNHASRTNINKIKMHNFNQFPVIKGVINNILGIVSVKKLFNSTNTTNELLQEIANTSSILYIPEVAKVTKLIDIFRKKQTKIAIVVDEYGEVEGLVTFNDILKTFVGDLAIYAEGTKPDVVKRKDGSYTMNGSVLIEEVMEQLQLSSVPGDDDEDYRTLASFILKQLNNIPRTGDSFQASGWEFRVIEMDKFRIERVLITKIDDRLQPNT